jgi:hypothetical protein
MADFTARHRLISWTVLTCSTLWPLLASAAPPPAPDPVYRTKGYWEQPYDWGIAGIHSVLLHGAGDSHSQVLVFNTGEVGLVWKVDPMDALAPGDLTPVATENSNIFCGGHSVLKDGRALITGGNEYSDQGTDHVNIFDPMLQPPRFVSPRPSNMFDGRYYPTNTTLADGTVLVTAGRRYQEFVGFGGAATSGLSNSVTVLGCRLDPEITGFPPSGTLPSAREGHAAAFDSLLNGAQSSVGYRYAMRMIVFGGRDATSTLLNDVHALYRDELDAWSWESLSPDPDPVWGVPQARMYHTACTVAADSSIVYFGGRNAAGQALNDVWKLHLYRGANGRWTRLLPSGGGPPVARWGHVAVYDEALTRILVFGGRSSSQVFGDLLSLSLGSSPSWTWPVTTGNAPEPREGHVAILDTRWPRKRLFVFGGTSAAGTALGDIHQLDLLQATPAWSAFATLPDSTNGMPGTRTGMAGIYEPIHDRWLIHGGDTNGPDMAGGKVGDLWQLRFTPLGDSPGSHHAVGVRDGVSRSSEEDVYTPTWTRDIANLTEGITGHSAVLDPRWMNSSLPELFYPQFDFWQPLYSARKWQLLYPFMFLLPNGYVFYAGPQYQTSLLDVQNGVWLPQNFNVPFLGGSAVQYLPGKVMKCGNQGADGTSETAVIDFTAQNPAWRMTGTISPMTPRVEHNLTLLPTGRVLLSGGLSLRLDIATAERRPQMWDPLTEQYSDPDLLAPDPVNRDYHSTALLLPDGRVLSTGGEIKSHPTDRSRLTATIYWPPYLFDSAGALAARPVIDGTVSAVGYGSTFLLDSPQAASIASVVLMRPGSVTHAFNQEQRYVPLEFEAYGGDWLRITTPANGNLAPAGYYMLFIVNADSVPSVANWNQVGTGTELTAVPDVAPLIELSARPNPLDASTRIHFGLPVSSQVDVSLFDVAGRKVRALHAGRLAAGFHELIWDARSDAGREVATGFYFARIEAGGHTKSLKLVVRR